MVYEETAVKGVPFLLRNVDGIWSIGNVGR
jgi:hypothetical protein